jgi:LmeA-like phospholipid-binding
VIKILVLLLILAAVLTVGDVEARLYAEHQFAHRIDTNVPGAHATANISSFPFVGRLAMTGTVRKIRAHLANVTSGRFTFDTVDVAVTGVQLDRKALFQDQRIQVLRIDSGTVTADMTEAAVDRALGGLPVKLANGAVQLKVNGINLVGRLTVVANQLRLEVTGVPVNVPIPKLPALPCVGNAVVTTGHLQLTCNLTGIPPALVGATGQVSG